jgi:tetratricopeptide (TPR) repeat protein
MLKFCTTVQYYIQKWRYINSETEDNSESIEEIQSLYNDAEKLLRKVTAIRERVFGIEHPDTAITYNNLGRLYSKQGRYKEAEEYYLKELKIYEVKFGVEYPSYKSIKPKLDDLMSYL